MKLKLIRLLLYINMIDLIKIMIRINNILYKFKKE